MLKLTNLFLFITLTISGSCAALSAKDKTVQFHKTVALERVQFGKVVTDESCKKKTAALIKKIKRDTAQYEEYLVELIGDTSCAESYEKYASFVEDALMQGGINPQKIKVTYFRKKTGRGDCTLSRAVDVKLYLGNKINNDIDNDGVPNKLDKCPDTPKNSIVSQDGCVHKTSVILLNGYKKHTAIVLKTATETLVLDTPLKLVTLNSDKKISKPKKINKKELKSLMGSVIASADAKQYRYVFYFNGVKLETESKKRVKEMLKRLSSIKGAYISIVGNTDTFGTVANNRILGLKRANVIANIIKSKGFKYLKMDVASHSELDLAVPTADETRELANRRVEVLIQ